mmetsp:Transcript_30494/g.101377  ORF Transcript_30494/g.101377 Transcript_30494/m.101377 type:complete len:314 (-) Transcript_30494:739-1680(-)
MRLDDLKHLAGVVVRVRLHRRIRPAAPPALLRRCRSCSRLRILLRRRLRPWNRRREGGRRGGGRLGGEGGRRGLEDERQMEHGPGLAAIDDASQEHTFFERCDQEAVHLIIEDHAGRAEVDGAERLVAAAVSPLGAPEGAAACLQGQGAAVAAVVEKQRVARPRPLDEPLHRGLHRGAAGRGVLAIIGEDADRGLGVALPQQVELHLLDISMADFNLQTLLPDIVNAYKERSALAARHRLPDARRGVQVQLPTAAQHRRLLRGRPQRKAAGTSAGEPAHSPEQLDPRASFQLLLCREQQLRAPAFHLGAVRCP